MHVHLYEPPDDDHDPFAHLRPSSPPPAVPHFDVVVTDAGSHRPALVAALLEALGLQEWDVRNQLMNLPCTLARGVPAPRAEAAAANRRAGASVDLVGNDG